MDAPKGRHRFSITLRGESLPSLPRSSTPPKIREGLHVQSLQALIVSFIPSDHHIQLPPIATLTAQICRAAQHPSPRDRITRLLASYSLYLNEAELDVLESTVQKVQGPPGIAKRRSRTLDVVAQISAWNDDSASIFDACMLASGEARLEKLNDAKAPTLTTSNAGSSSNSTAFDPTWLRNRCAQLAVVLSGDGLSAGEMAASVLGLLTDEIRSDEQLQGELFDAFAGDFDAVVDVLSRRAELCEHADAIQADCAQAEAVPSVGLSRVGRGVRARKRSDMERRTQVSSQITVRDVRQEAIEREQRKVENRLRRAGLLQEGLHEEDDFAIGALGGSAYEERQRHFPGVGVEGDSVIGAVDRVGLPRGSRREMGKGYEEIYVPPPERKESRPGELIEIREALKDHPELLEAMKGVTRLNRLQSAVYPVAFGSDENMLVCAPTGAGKTNVALLTIFREIVAVKRREQRSFKVVYVAPMKALAAEVTDKFGKRLGPLGLLVKEYTGDMNLSRKEALETHVLVTTPEKWDVVTRKVGSDLGNAVTLFIVDEIHLLHDERGAVLESIVARTLRLSETAEKQIRLVGLSATLPNYADVGAFMKVNPDKGLFHFDGSHRPVPLSQTFIGISEGGTSNANEARRRREAKLHEMAWKKVKDSLKRGHQAMIFVHSRRGTSLAAREMLSRAAQDGLDDIFLGGESKANARGGASAMNGAARDGDSSSVIPSWAMKEINRSKTADIRELCGRGVGIHNAGLPRPDRKLVEKLFAEGVIRLLCCTATLAWGVNLPARTVVIMGTELYDPDKGGFVQIGMLDVMQIFGRAGRPQFDTEGEGTIITMHEHLGKYLSLLTASVPIESQLGSSASRLADHLNAEIISGTVSTIGEGVRWLSYTYLSVRMPKNPLVYGIDWSEVEADSGLHSRRASLIEQASKALDDARMCRYDPTTGALAPTDLGRVASHFYVSHQTIVLWNEVLGNLSLEQAVTDADWEEVYGVAIHAIACATEFEHLRSRQEDAEELDYLTRIACPIPLRSGSETREGKVSILLQSHISRAHIRMSDLSYVIQSATRLLRALFEVSLRRGFPSLSLAALELARASESRIWPFQHPLWQFTYGNHKQAGVVLNAEVIATIESSGESGSFNELRKMTKEDLGVLVRAPSMIATVQKALKAIPVLEIFSAQIAPISRTILKISLRLFPNFRWNDAIHGSKEAWWMWVEDYEENRIYHSQKILLIKDQVNALSADQAGKNSSSGKKTIDVSFYVPVFDPPSSQYWVRVESEEWHTGGGSSTVLSLSKMKLPEEDRSATKLLDLRPLPVHAVLNSEEAALFDSSMSHFNPLQSQAYHTARHTNTPMLVSAPYGSGKFTIAEFGVLKSLQDRPNTMVVCLALSEDTLIRRRNRWKQLGGLIGNSVMMQDSVTAEYIKNTHQGSSILLCTPDKWSHILCSLEDSTIANRISLFVLDDMHLLSYPRGSAMEIIVARIRQISQNQQIKASSLPRLVALCGPIPNAGALARWLSVEQHTGLFSFSNDIRQVPCTSHVVGVAGDKYVSRMQSMNRSLFATIQRYSSKKPVLVYVSSRSQCFFTAQDLIRSAKRAGRGNVFRRGSQENDHSLKKALRDISDPILARFLNHGVGLYHEGMPTRECDAMEGLYDTEHIQVLIATFSMAKKLEASSHLVIVKGTEFFSAKQKRYEDMPIQDILYMIGKAGRPGIDSECNAVIFVHEQKKTLFKKFLHETLPVESSVHEDLPELLLREIAEGRVRSLSDAVELLTCTFLFERLKTNPGYYGLLKERGTTRRDVNGRQSEAEHVLAIKWCADKVQTALEELVTAGCIHLSQDDSVKCTSFGIICSMYHLSHGFLEPFTAQLRKSQDVTDVLRCMSSATGELSIGSVGSSGGTLDHHAQLVSEQFCNAHLCQNIEVAQKALRLNKSEHTDMRNARLECYSLFLAALEVLPRSAVGKQQLYRSLEKIIGVSFDLAVELGSLSLVLNILKISQSLYQGVLPCDNIWVLTGSASENIAMKGTEAGFASVSSVLADPSRFKMFLAQNSSNEAQRASLTRWVDRLPNVSVKAHISEEDQTRVVIDGTVTRQISLSRDGSDTNSRVACKRTGGFALLVGSLEDDALYSAKRIPGPAGTKYAFHEELCTGSRKQEKGNLKVWCISDTFMGVDSSEVVSS